MFFLCNLSLHAENFRETKPNAWSATTVNDALEQLYGRSQTIADKRVWLKAPKIASNGGAIPVSISTSLSVKSMAILSDVNPKALIAVYSVYDIAEYTTKVKMPRSGNLVLVVEGTDGNLYSTHQKVEVALGGCEGGDGGSSYFAPYSQAYVPPPMYNQESYAHVGKNRFREVSLSPLSTFGSDVDTASYANIRRHILDEKRLPQKGVVRVEEMLNYFNYNYAEPKQEEPFAIQTRVGESLWNKNTKLIQIGLQSKRVEIAKLPASNLVFLLDVSGSMTHPNKLPLLTKSLKLLVKQLRAKDRVSIVVYAGNSGLILDRAKGNEIEKINLALSQLRAGGSTAGGEGIELAYMVAKKAFIKGGNNRIILATDGDFNVGQSSQSALVELIEKKRKSGIYLTVLGFGSGNYKDSIMELLADKGNGNYAYIDSLLEAKKVLVTQMSGTLYTVAKDVKIQVEFNPKMVQAYRLIGYENRLLKSEDFKDDKVDAGEVGMGHSVTALYEVKLQNKGAKSVESGLKYQSAVLNDFAELATVKIRYKKPDGKDSIEMSKVITMDDREIKEQEFNFAQTVVGFGMLLGNSEFKNALTYAELISLAKASKGEDENGYRAEFIKMMEGAELLGG